MQISQLESRAPSFLLMTADSGSSGQQGTGTGVTQCGVRLNSRRIMHRNCAARRAFRAHPFLLCGVADVLSPPPGSPDHVEAAIGPRDDAGVAHELPAADAGVEYRTASGTLLSAQAVFAPRQVQPVFTVALEVREHPSVIGRARRRQACRSAEHERRHGRKHTHLHARGDSTKLADRAALLHLCPGPVQWPA
jgi:hypothetical protein